MHSTPWLPLPSIQVISSSPDSNSFWPALFSLLLFSLSHSHLHVLTSLLTQLGFCSSVLKSFSCWCLPNSLTSLFLHTCLAKPYPWLNPTLHLLHVPGQLHIAKEQHKPFHLLLSSSPQISSAPPALPSNPATLIYSLGKPDSPTVLFKLLTTIPNLHA